MIRLSVETAQTKLLSKLLFLEGPHRKQTCPELDPLSGGLHSVIPGCGIVMPAPLRSELEAGFQPNLKPSIEDAASFSLFRLPLLFFSPPTAPALS